MLRRHVLRGLLRFLCALSSPLLHLQLALQVIDGAVCLFQQLLRAFIGAVSQRGLNALCLLGECDGLRRLEGGLLSLQADN